MTDLKEVNVHIEDVDKAIDIVGNFLNSVQIPGSRAADWAITGRVLGELRSAIAQQKVQLPKSDVDEESVPEEEATAA